MGNPTINAMMRGTLMQFLMVVIGKFVPAIGQMPNFYAIAGTVLAALTGAMYARMAPGASTGSVASGGAIAGGGSSLIGGILAVVTGQWPGFQVVQLVAPLVAGGVGGGLGGVLGRLMR